MPDTIRLRIERAEDRASVHALHDAAFGADAAIPDLVDDLRRLDAPLPTVSLVAADPATGPLGHVMLSHAWLDTWQRLIDVMVLSPLGVRPDAQRQQIGTLLVKAALAEAERLGAPMVFLEGSPDYYGVRGFEPAGARDIRRPSLRIPERAFQVCRLQGWTPEMTGTFVYRDVHWKHGVGLYRNA
ncbi:GNAT family N-acetyltransferase [Halovulum sp. GXIMD14794]